MADPSTPRVAPVPPGVHVRRPVHDDAAAIVAVVRAAETVACGHSLAGVGDVLYDWADPRFSLERDAWVAVNEDGALVAYAYSWATDPTETIDIYGVVHPDVDERGLDAHLMDIALRRAGEQSAAAGLDARDVTVSAWCLRGDARRRELYERLGFKRTRVFLHMVMAAADLPEPPPWPDGITATPFRPGLDERTLHAVLEEAFLDHFRPRPIPFDVWSAQVLADQDFDPDLVLIARDGDDAAGAVVALTLPDAGCVVQLGVRRAWRGRGVGTALLVYALHLLAARGCESLSLGVDSESPTGAADLYRRVGMRPQHENDIYERALGEGA
jgi:mycothiol synthase